MNCLWLIIILALCGGNFCGCDEASFGCGKNDSRGRDRDGCGCRRDDRRENRRDERRDCRRDDGCGCDDGRRRGVSSLPPFGRNSDGDTCGCDIQEDN